MTFLIMNNFKYSILNGTFSKRDDEILENLINSLKLLNIDEVKFKEFMTSNWDG